MSAALQILKGDDAWQLLSDHVFKQDWEALHKHCSWATPFQTYGFVTTWFNAYKTQCSPIIVMQRNDGGSLYGLLVLAFYYNNNCFHVAGAHQAEYQTWLEDKQNQGSFIITALNNLKMIFPHVYMRFRYLPKDVPIEILKNCLLNSNLLELKTYTCPIRKLTESYISESLRKKSNKSRLNRLKRFGMLSFERINDVENFSAALEQFIPYYDLRQGTTNNLYPFLQDTHKRKFHIELFRNNPDLLHVTLMKVGDIPISMHIGIIDVNSVSFAIIAYSPMFSKFSPGKFHLLLLCRQLLQEGKTIFDLTPGDDAWKERFANSHNQVFELIIHKSVFAKHIQHFYRKIVNFSNLMLRPFRLSPKSIFNFMKRIVSLDITSTYAKILKGIFERKEYKLYVLKKENTPLNLEPNPEIKKDCLEHLLLYGQTKSQPNKQTFLKQALSRLENGEHVYTVSNGDKLLHYTWLIEKQNKYDFLQKESLIYDSYTWPEALDTCLLEKTLKKILFDFRNSSNTNKIYTSCCADDKSSCHFIEKLGFNYYISILSRRLFWITSIWQSVNN